MKKKSFLIAAIITLVGTAANAQFSSSSPGGSSPQYNNALVGVTDHLLFNSQNGVINWGGSTAGDLFFRKLSTQGNITNYLTHMVIKSNGNVGIGNITSTSMTIDQKLVVRDGNILVQGTGNFDANNEDAILYMGDQNNYIKARYGTGVILGAWGNANAMYITQNGIGIGAAPPDNVYKLAVCGKIRATEIKVEAPWCDFVFEDSYKLRPLKEVENFINENGHLPEIPSAAEVEKNGVDVGMMESRLLLKVEELTLYMIDLNKKVETLEAENKALKASQK
jgi:hypothetical protein